jgi:hypothetical protein
MPEVTALTVLFDPSDERYQKEFKQILNQELSPSERRIAIARICPKTHRPVPSDQVYCRASEAEVKAVVTKIVRLLDHRRVPRRSS